MAGLQIFAVDRSARISILKAQADKVHKHRVDGFQQNSTRAVIFFSHVQFLTNIDSADSEARCSS